MDYRRRTNRKVIYPSFTLVVNQYFARRLAFAHRKQLVWKHVPNYHSRPTPCQNTRRGEWAMTMIDYRDEDDMSRARKPVLSPESATRIDPYIYGTSNAPESAPKLGLPPVDDDAMSGISFLDLEDEQATSYEGERPVRAGLSLKGTHVFYTCKAFLDLCTHPFRRTRKASV